MRALFVGMVGFSALFTAAACSSGSSDSSPPPSGAESDAGAASDSAGFGDAAMPDAASHVDAGVDAALSFPNGESVGAGDDTACALGHGGVYCWRDDTNDGGLADTPALAVGTEKFVQFTTPPQIGYCAIDSTGAKSCSTLDLTSYDIAKFTSGISNQYCFLEHGGTVRCWGDDSVGEVGNGSTTTFPTEVVSEVALPAKAIDVGAFNQRTCAVTIDGALYCWGLLATGMMKTTATKVDLGGKKAASLGIGVLLQDIAVVLEDGSVRLLGQDGSNEEITHLAGAKVLGGESDNVLCATMGDGSVKCIGLDGKAQDPSLPEPIVELTGGFASFVARGSSGAVYRWTRTFAASKVAIP